MATLRDVSREAGVGISTVSMVLNKARLVEQIPETTQQRIRDAALKLKYRPNAGGRQLKHHRSRTVALFVSAEAHRSSLSPELLYAINDELLKHDYALHFVRLPDVSLSDSSPTPRFLRQQEVDGVLVNYNVDMPQRFVDLIHHYEMPAVFLNIKRPCNAVYFDHATVTRQVVDRLIALGHRRIYLVNYSGRFAHYSIQDTADGYEAAMRAHGLDPITIDDRIEYKDRLRFGIDLLESRFRGLAAPTAILSMWLATALPMIQSAAAIGRRIPEQLSLVTTDGSGQPAVLNPPLSHIFLPWNEVGRIGVRMLLNRIEGGTGEPPSGCIECQWRNPDGSVAAPGGERDMTGAT